MTWVQVGQSITINGRQYISDDVVDMPDADAAIWIAKGHVRPIYGIDDNTAAIAALDVRLTYVEENYTRWRGDWVPGDYLKNDMVNNANGLYIANVDTSTQPIVYRLGDPAWQIPDSPTWVNDTIATATLYTVNEYTFADVATVNQIRVWIPSDSADIHYRLILSNITNPSSPIVEVGTEFSGDSTVVGWLTLNTADAIFEAGTVLRCILETWNTSGSTSFAGNWQYTKPQNSGTPAPGQIIQSSRNPELFQISKIDDDTTARGPELESLGINDHIAGLGMQWSIVAIADNTTWMEFTVEPAVQAATIGVASFTFTDYAVQPIPYVYLVDHWLGYSTAYITSARGGAGDALDSIVYGDDAAGFDFEIEGVAKSADWDIAATEDLDLLLAGGVGVRTKSAPQQPFLAVEHMPNYTYLSVDTTPVDIVEWDQSNTVDFGGLDWGDVSGKATIPISGFYQVQASFVVRDGQNVDVMIEIVHDDGVTIEQIASSTVTTATNDDFSIVIDETEYLNAGDLVWLRTSTSDVGGRDVEIINGVASIRTQWIP